MNIENLQIQEGVRDRIVASLYQEAERIADRALHQVKPQQSWDTKLDNVLTSPIWGFSIMILLLGVVFWITIIGANYPSEMLAGFFLGLEEQLNMLLMQINAPEWFIGLFVGGLVRTLGWVISVMFPPMAIFFPLFTLLEDLGYLPRVAFNLDYLFKKCGTHGKQALTMCMGFGCNAAGVISCRIIDSPRERLIATLTNNFIPCNGRFPTLILMGSLFLTGVLGSLGVTMVVVGGVLLGIAMSLIVSYLLSRTLLQGVPSTFTLELPPYRKPQIGRVIVRSIFDRTLFVLGRAITVAAPAGLVIWLMANIQINGMPFLTVLANTIDPFANLMGLDGIILLAFILGLPANEIVVPLIFMGYLATGGLIELTGLNEIRQLLIVDHGWTWLTGVNIMLFTLFHYPCGTTLLTIFKETKSRKWTLLSFLIPTGTGITLCILVTQIVRGLGLV